MNDQEQFMTPSGRFTLNRIPETDNGSLRAWDAADELLINTLFNDYQEKLKQDDTSLLVINDAFGALTVAFNGCKVDNWSDSLISHQAAQKNLAQNKLNNTDHIRFIPSTEEPEATYQFVVIKIPKTLSLLEDQLHRLKPYLQEDTIIIASAMTKHIHNSTIALFEKIIGTTTTSRATKKARLVYSQNDIINDVNNKKTSPFPHEISDEKTQLNLVNHANVFSKDKLDQGTRFLIQHMGECPTAEHIIDIGCGNGALGIIAKRHQPNLQISFVDESYNAVASAKDSYQKAYPESADDAYFYASNGLKQFSLESDKPKAQLVLCNPPFHQVHSIGDQIAWEMFTESREALDVDGEMWVVGNRHLGYHIKLKKVFGNCRTIASNPKFVILAATKLKSLNRKNKAKSEPTKD